MPQRHTCELCGAEFTRYGVRPYRFCSHGCKAKAVGLARTRPKLERFMEKIEVDSATGCWNWLAFCDRWGYGRFKWSSDKGMVAFRAAWLLFRGPVPEGLELDHLCRNARCVNPDHLEPVTTRENILRSDNPAARNARKTHCKHGHPFDEENTYVDRDGRRSCRACARGRGRQKVAA